jgi:arylsulfatase A-like enzyme
VDLAPTVAALAGCDLPRAVVGRSLLPIFAGADANVPTLPAGEIGDPMPAAPRPPPGTALISEFGRRLMLETERHKIIFDTETHAALGLYDLLNDVDEQANMLHTAAGRNLLDSLRWRLGDALLPLRALPV